MGSSSSLPTDTPIVYNRQQHQALIDEHGFPVYVLFIDLRWSVGGGFSPRTAKALKKLAMQWGTAGTAMQHWALMVDGNVYELARNPDPKQVADQGMLNNPTFKMPTAISFNEWHKERQPKEVKWRKYYYTNKTKDQITTAAQAIARELQRYDELNNNCQHFVTKLYDQLGCGYDTGSGWAPMSSEILPKQMPITAEMLANVNNNMLSTALSAFMATLTLAQI